MKKRSTIFAAIALYLVSTGASFATFRYLGTGPITPNAPLPTTAEGELAIDPNAPRNKVCPINGKKYTKQIKIS